MSNEIASIGDITRVHAAARGAKTALSYEDRSWTYSELDSEANRVAQALLAAGVEPQDRVAFLDKNTAEYFPFLFGAGKVNAVTVAVNWRLAPPEMEYILGNAAAKVLLIGDEFLEHLEKMDLPSVTTTIVIGSGGGLTAYGDWLAQQPDEDPLVPSGPDDTCYQLYTSGTTGLPKGVELTNENFFSMLPAACGEWYFDEDSVNLVAMPLFHIAGSGWGVVGLYNGGSNVLLRDIDPAAILKLIPEHGITNALLVPAVLQFLLMTPGIDATDFSSMRAMVYGASPITEEVLVGSMKAMGCKFVQAYGLTETTGGVTILRADDHDPGGPRADLLRSAGKPWGDVEIRIVDTATGQDRPDGEVGEIWCRTIQNMKGYWADERATDLAFPEGKGEDGRGWFTTGDAGYLRDGYLYIHDRVKDMIVSGAENIYPAEIENVLMAHPEIADAAVIGVPDEKWGETVKAIITPAADAAPSDEAIIAYTRENLAHYKCPTSIDRVEVIPRNPSGKILKTELRKPYWEGHDRMVN
ncbi:MAG: long-chain-fatty-acid--CoA ligase [Acidimicrobiales bacterium]